jgi:CBS domain-containing protein
MAGVTPTSFWLVPGAVLLGLVVGGVATVCSATLYWIEDAFHRLPVHWMWWPAIGAVVVGLGGLIDPRVLGAGYANIQALVDGSVILRAAILLGLVKATVWLVALGSGTSGGVLAPLLIIGGAMGAVAGHWLGHPGFWALAGMAAMMSAAMRAPLTAVMLAVELTGRLDALPMVIAASVTGYALAVLVLRRSILTEKMARRGRHISQEYGVDPLAIARIGEIMTRKPVTLAADSKVADMVAFFEAGARHRIYPVVDDAGRPIGLVSRVDALRWRGAEPADTTLGEVMSDRSLNLVTPDMPAIMAADLMIAEEVSRLPVVDPATGRLVGILARRDLLQARVGSHRTERKRQRFVRRAGGAA